MKRSALFKLALAFAWLLPALSAQTLQFGNLNVTQVTANNASTDVALSLGSGSTSGAIVRTAASNRGDYALSFGNTSDPAAGILISNVSQNGRDDSATGNAFTTFYATSATAFDATGYWIALFRAAQGDEVNMNVNFGFFPYDRYLAGYVTNGSESDSTFNNTTINSITGTPGIRIGTEFQSTATVGQSLLNLTSLGGSSTTGVLLVCGGKNEDNYALSRANTDGTFSIFCHDNGLNGTTYEDDPIAFVYLPVSSVGTNSLVALGRVNSTNGAVNSAVTTDVAGGTFTITKGSAGQWYLKIPGQSPATGTLLVSAEGGASNNSDNIVSVQWDATNNRWVIESRDLSGETALPTLQNGATAAEDIFSFAFFTSAPGNTAPKVSLVAPVDGATVLAGSTVTLSATADDVDGSVTKVEFFDGSTKLGEDGTAPYSLDVSGITLGGHSFTVRATDNATITTTSTPVLVTVAPAGTGGLFFDGRDDYVTFGKNSALGLMNFTLECWFRRDGAGISASSGTGGITAVPLITKGRGESDGSNVDCNYFFGIDAATGKLTADFEDLDGGLNHPVIGSTVVPYGVWQHAAVTFTASTNEWRLYLNGGLEAFASSDGMVPRFDSIQHAAIGSALNSVGTPSGAFLGLIDEVRIWNYARSQAEIQSAVNIEIPNASGLVAHWGMVEGLGNTLTSSASGAIVGNLVNGPVWSAGAPFNANLAPDVTLLSPANGANLIAPGTVSLSAAASDPDGSVAQIEFLRDGVVLTTLTAAPYAYQDASLPVGTYVYTARVTDNAGVVRTSTAATVTVAFDPLHPPANTALRFNGVDDYVTMGLASELGVGDTGFTLECWFLKEGTGITSSSGSGGVAGVPLFGKGRGESDGGTIDCDYFFGINASGKLVADFETYPATGLTTGQNYPVTGTHAAITNGAWHHAAVTYDGATATWTLYLDGVAAGSATAAAGARPRFDSIQHFGIASAFNSTGVREGAFAGRIDEVRVWNYARSAAEIAAAKGLEIATAPGLVGRYGLNEAVGRSAANSATSTGNPVGAIVGNPVWVEGAPFTVANVSPAVTLDAPAAGDSTVYPTPFGFAASATDNDGGIARVEFFVDGAKVGTSTAAPYTFVWTPQAVGTYTVAARAVDVLGAAQTSASSVLTVTPNPNQPPVLSIQSPATDATGVGSSTSLSLGIVDAENDGATVTFYGRKTVPSTPGKDFTLVTLPDTQYYSENTGGDRFQQFLDQTNWIVNQRNTMNIAFVSHMGDIVDDGDSIPEEWVNANQAMAVLENHATTLRAYGIPFGAAPGNHDQSVNGDPSSPSAYYNQYFGYTRYEGRPYWGGHYGDNNDNNYQLFSASGLDFIILHLEYRTSADPAVIAWADALLKKYSQRRAIVTSHWIIGQGNPAAFGGQGKQIYDGLKNNPNLFLLLCGHIHAEGRRSDVYQGRTVYSVLQDYQGSPDGGSGFLRYYTFSPANNLITVRSYSPTLRREVLASDAIPGFQGTFTINYDMQSSVSEWIPLGTATVAAGGTVASIKWIGLEPDSNYEWYADVYDGINHAKSTPSQFSTASVTAPSVTLVTPFDGVTYTSSTSITLKATATAADGSIARVDFFNDTTKLGSSAVAPYSITTGLLTAGNYTFSAVAVDDRGKVKLSNLATITVADRDNVAPSVSLVSPAAGATCLLPGPITLTGNASDSDGAIDNVAFYVDGALVGRAEAAPYACNWSNPIPGSHLISVVATDNDGITAATAGVPVQVSFAPADATADSDGDLIGQLLEYALGLSAHVPNRSGLPALAASPSGGLNFTFYRAQPGLTYKVQASDDLDTWSDLAVDPGVVGSDVTVSDVNNSSLNRFLRLTVSDGVTTTATVPVGRITYAFSGGRDTAVSFPLLPSVGEIAGHPAGIISSVGATTLVDANAGWTPGALSQPAAPYLVRITSGASAGRTFPVSTLAGQANTDTRLTLVTGSLNLTALGIKPGVDSYELVVGETLGSLFPNGTLKSGTTATADLVRLWSGSAWVTYYHDGVNWRRQGAGVSDDVLVRPDQGLMLTRRGASLAYVSLGAVPSVAAGVDVNRSALNWVSLLPLRRTFAAFSLQTLLPDWASNSANPTAADHVRLWSGTAWVNYYYEGGHWMGQGVGDASTEILFEPGRPVFIVRPSGSGRNLLQQNANY